MPVTVMLTPCEVYTAVEVTVRVIVLRESLQRLHQIELKYFSIEGDVFLKRYDTKLRVVERKHLLHLTII